MATKMANAMLMTEDAVPADVLAEMAECFGE